MRSIKIITATVAGLAFALAPLAVVSAAPTNNIYVSKLHCSDAGPGNSNHPFCTIQEGVDAVAVGGTVNVDKGNYTEQVNITKNNIKLVGNGNNSVIFAPAAMDSPKAIVEVNGATGVTIKDFKISGPGGSSCDSLEYGVRIEGNGQATVTDDYITKIEDSPFSGCQNGVAVRVGFESTNSYGSAVISDNNIDNYQKGGIVVDGTGSSATIHDNNVTGAGPTAVNGQNGIQISRGATATLTGNTIKGNVFSPQSVVADGILFYQAGIVNVKNNVSNHNDAGFDIEETNNSTFTGNVANNNTTDGIYASYIDGDSQTLSSHGNVFRDNSARNNTGSTAFEPFDIEDDSTGTGTVGTANTWHSNGCKTSSPVNLCKQ